jgi:ribulose-phosphate 3-epimerase
MCADFLSLGAEVERFAGNGIEWLHEDIMDGHYVPNFSLGIDLCRALARAAPNLAHDVHLMVESPEHHIAAFAGLPRARISIHPETTRHAPAVLGLIRKAGASPGIAISPAVAVESLRHLLPLVDAVTVMTVNPGFAGQELLDWCLPKISEVRAWADCRRPELDVAVDGNVSWANLPRMRAAGANLFVLGKSSLFQDGVGRIEALGRIRSLLESVTPAKTQLLGR